MTRRSHYKPCGCTAWFDGAAIAAAVDCHRHGGQVIVQTSDGPTIEAMKAILRGVPA